MVLLQDLHTQPDAQRAEGRIVEHLHRTYGLTRIAAEGAVGPFDLAFAQQFPQEKGLRTLIAQTFLTAGEMTGYEAQAITEQLPVAIHGVEDGALYAEHGALFRQILDIAPAAQQTLERLTQALEALKPGLYPKPLRTFDATVAQFHADPTDRSDLPTYLTYLADVAQRQGIGLKAVAPNLARLQALQVREATLNRQQAEEQLRLLVADLPRRLRTAPVATRARLEELTVQFGRGAIAATYFYPELVALARHAAVDLDAYPAVVAFSDYLTQAQALQAHRLWAELEQVEWALTDRLAASDDAKTLARLVRHAHLLTEFFHLRLTNEQLAYYQAHRAEFTEQAFTDFLARHEHRRTGAPAHQSPGWEAHLPLLERFYILAQARDAALVANTLRLLDARDSSLGTRDSQTPTPRGTRHEARGTGHGHAVVLVAGGFHTPGMTALLRERNVPYVVISPTASGELDEALYHRLVRGETASLAQLVALAQAQRPTQTARAPTSYQPPGATYWDRPTTPIELPFGPKQLRYLLTVVAILFVFFGTAEVLQYLQEAQQQITALDPSLLPQVEQVQDVVQRLVGTPSVDPMQAVEQLQRVAVDVAVAGNVNAPIAEPVVLATTAVPPTTRELAAELRVWLTMLEQLKRERFAEWVRQAESGRALRWPASDNTWALGVMGKRTVYRGESGYVTLRFEKGRQSLLAGRKIRRKPEEVVAKARPALTDPVYVRHLVHQTRMILAYRNLVGSDVARSVVSAAEADDLQAWLLAHEETPVPDETFLQVTERAERLIDTIVGRLGISRSDQPAVLTWQQEKSVQQAAELLATLRNSDQQRSELLRQEFAKLEKGEEMLVWFLDDWGRVRAANVREGSSARRAVIEVEALQRPGQYHFEQEDRFVTLLPRLYPRSISPATTPSSNALRKAIESEALAIAAWARQQGSLLPRQAIVTNQELSVLTSPETAMAVCGEASDAINEAVARLRRRLDQPEAWREAEASLKVLRQQAGRFRPDWYPAMAEKLDAALRNFEGESLKKWQTFCDASRPIRTQLRLMMDRWEYLSRFGWVESRLKQVSALVTVMQATIAWADGEGAQYADELFGDESLGSLRRFVRKATGRETMLKSKRKKTRRKTQQSVMEAVEALQEIIEAIEYRLQQPVTVLDRVGREAERQRQGARLVELVHAIRQRLRDWVDARPSVAGTEGLTRKIRLLEEALRQWQAIQRAAGQLLDVSLPSTPARKDVVSLQFLDALIQAAGAVPRFVEAMDSPVGRLVLGERPLPSGTRIAALRRFYQDQMTLRERGAVLSGVPSALDPGEGRPILERWGEYAQQLVSLVRSTEDNRYFRTLVRRSDLKILKQFLDGSSTVTEESVAAIIKGIRVRDRSVRLKRMKKTVQEVQRLVRKLNLLKQAKAEIDRIERELEAARAVQSPLPAAQEKVGPSVVSAVTPTEFSGLQTHMQQVLTAVVRRGDLLNMIEQQGDPKAVLGHLLVGQLGGTKNLSHALPWPIVQLLTRTVVRERYDPITCACLGVAAAYRAVGSPGVVWRRRPSGTRVQQQPMSAEALQRLVASMALVIDVARRGQLPPLDSGGRLQTSQEAFVLVLEMLRIAGVQLTPGGVPDAFRAGTMTLEQIGAALETDDVSQRPRYLVFARVPFLGDWHWAFIQRDAQGLFFTHDGRRHDLDQTDQAHAVVTTAPEELISSVDQATRRSTWAGITGVAEARVDPYLQPDGLVDSKTGVVMTHRGEDIDGRYRQVRKPFGEHLKSVRQAHPDAEIVANKATGHIFVASQTYQGARENALTWAQFGYQVEHEPIELVVESHAGAIAKQQSQEGGQFTATLPQPSSSIDVQQQLAKSLAATVKEEEVPTDDLQRFMRQRADIPSQAFPTVATAPREQDSGTLTASAVGGASAGAQIASQPRFEEMRDVFLVVPAGAVIGASASAVAQIAEVVQAQGLGGLLLLAEPQQRDGLTARGFGDRVVTVEELARVLANEPGRRIVFLGDFRPYPRLWGWLRQEGFFDAGLVIEPAGDWLNPLALHRLFAEEQLLSSRRVVQQAWEMRLLARQI